jgi:putative colanic acid biosysnthesis UDP-glucose lipid carrier transferase
VKISLLGFVQRAADAAAVLASFAAGYWIYHANSKASVTYSLWGFLGLGTLAVLLFLIVFQSVRLYERKVSLLNVVETRRLLIGWALGSLILFAVTFYLRVLDLSRVMVSVSLLIFFFLLLLQRSLFYQLQLLAVIQGGERRKVIIFGAGVVGRHLYKRIYHSPALGIHVVGFLDDDTTLWGEEVPITEVRRKNGNVVIGGLDRLGYLIDTQDVKEVFVAIPNATYQRNLEIVQQCRKLGLSVSVVPPTYGHQMHNLEVEDIGGIPILREKESRPHALYPVLKRMFDIVVSASVLVLLSPLCGLVALLVKYDSPGSVIFRQRRVGLNGQEFDFYKFRTMVADANPYSQTPHSSDDPRITRFGRWLRRTSLDELPQFWNVLKGEMSIVGPRPEMPYIVATYNDEQRERLKVKPGITGVWQISAVRGEPIHANMEYDLFYIEHRSLLLDLIIMIKTVLTAIRGIGAV